MQVSDDSGRAAKYVLFGFISIKLLAIILAAITAIGSLIGLLTKMTDIAEWFHR
jgi:hypothetical protein